VAGGLTLFLYFLLRDNFGLFLLLAIFLVGGGLSLAFLRVKGFPLPTVLKNSFIFLTRPRIYLWGKKSIPPKILKQVEKVREEEKEGSSLKVSRENRLGKLSTFLETK